MALDSTYLQVSDGTADAAIMHITNSRSIGATTIQVDTVAAIPAKFIAIYGTLGSDGFITAASMRNFYGHLSGGNLEIDGFLPGSTDNGNTDGQVVVIKPNTFWANFVAQQSVDAYTNSVNLKAGWIPFPATLTYASADTASGGATSTNGVSTYTATMSGDYSGVFSQGMRLWLTQTTSKFFIITKVDYSGGTTTLTFFGGTDYSLANATITAAYYSVFKAPYGFPLDPGKWTVVMKNTSSYSQSTPVASTWYNVNVSLSLTVPIGSFVVSYDAPLNGSKSSATAFNVWATLSTANNSESNADSSTIFVVNGASATLGGYFMARRSINLILTAKTLYYLNCRTSTAGGGVSVGFDGSQVPTFIFALCAYL